MSKVVLKGRFTGGALRYPKVTEEGKAPKYSAVLVLDEGEEKKLQAALDQAVLDKWSGKRPPGCQDFVMRVGDDPEFCSFERYYINPKASAVGKGGIPKKRPGTFIKRDGAVVELPVEDETIYPGCFVAMEIDVYGQDGDKARNIKPCVTTGLNKVMFMRDGERLSNETSADKAFEDFESTPGTNFGPEVGDNPFG